MDESLAVKTVMAGFKPLLEQGFKDLSEIGKSIPLPEFSEEIITQICKETSILLSKRTTVLRIEPPIYVVGDLHGNLLDLIRIFSLAKYPPASRFLFLGDYVDRGTCSIEVVLLLYAFQLSYPEHVFMIRGNHEFETINSTYGFHDEVLNYYSHDVFNAFNRSFDYLPIAAIIHNEIFCVHGGLSPHLKSIEQIETISRPFKSYESDFVADMLWSDPSIMNTTYVRSNRGSGVTFGENEVFDFLEKFKMKTIFRAHQCVRGGIQKFGSTSLYTIFSSSNYDENSNNSAGLIFISALMNLEAFSLPAITQLDKGVSRIEPFDLVNPYEVNEHKNHLPATINVKLKEIQKSSNSALKLKIKRATSLERYYGGIQKSPSTEVFTRLPLLTIQK